MNFRDIQPINKAEIERLTAKYAPYSDFNFTSLLSWNIDESAGFVVSENILMIRLPDYVSGEVVYSLLGDKNIDEHIHQLLCYSNELKFVPEETVKNIVDKSKYRIVEDRDQFDYIYHLHDLTTKSGTRHKHVRNKLNQFNTTYPDCVLATFDSISNQQRDTIMTIFAEWVEERNLPIDEIIMEKTAIERLIDLLPPTRLVLTILSIHEKPVGFSIHEIIDNANAVCHFQKSLRAYRNLDTQLTYMSSVVLVEKGCLFVNWEQDLGIPGLRQMKETHRPKQYLKKYKISLV